MPSVYRSLDRAGQEIRLLNILPSKDRSVSLRCTFTYGMLGVEIEPYEALSYTWGYPEMTPAMLLDGKPAKITQNLEAALLRLRRPDKVRTLWIDAVCVNQDDVEEKADQVFIMDRIYKTAVQVIVWLGEPDGGDRSAMTSLAVKNFSITNNIRMWRTQRKHGVQRGWRASNTALLTGEMDRATGGLETEIGLVAQLLDRPWWQRVWIVQEVILAKKVVIMCGPDEVPWESIKQRLGENMYGLKSKSGVHRPLRAYNGTVIDSKFEWPDAEYFLLDRMQDAWRSGEFALNFYDLLYRFRRFSCTLPQDRIFAFLGLVGADQSASINVDYTLPFNQLYVNVARSLIASHKHLLVLNCKREPYKDRRQFQQNRVYSLLNQGRFIDPQATVIDEPGGKPRKGWIRLPQGWERSVENDGIWFRDHTTGRRQRESPLQGQTLPSQSSEEFQCVPQGWCKEWDSMGRVRFTYASHQNVNSSFAELPSWVPDWNAYSNRDPAPLPELSDADSCCWASGKNRRVHFVPTSDPDSSSLGLRGMLFDTIKTIAPAWYPEAERLPISRSGVAILEEWEQLALAEVENCPYETSEGRFNAFWRTQLADYAGEKALPEDDKVFFNAWCDRTGWTPTVADLESKRLTSLWQHANRPSEEMALGDMFLHSYEAPIDGAAELTLGGIPKFIYNVTKDAFAKGSQMKERYRQIRSRIYRASTNRAMFVTSKGYLGLAPWNAKQGDSIVVLLGGCTPFILRPKGNAFTLVGEVFVYGIMGGELFGHEMGHARLRDFELV